MIGRLKKVQKRGFIWLLWILVCFMINVKDF